MLPSKLKALNGLSTDASSDDLSSAPVKITKEALVSLFHIFILTFCFLSLPSNYLWSATVVLNLHLN